MPPPFVAFARETGRPDETVVLVANLGPRARTRSLLLPLDGYFDALLLEDVLAEDPAATRVAVQAGAVRLELWPYELRWLRGRDQDPSGYRHWKLARGV